jgi:circadian clock protein KaiC
LLATGNRLALQDGGLTVDEEISSDSETLIKTGIAGLDDVLAGGFTPNRIYLIQGDPGSGKTTLGLQYLLEGVKNGESVLYVTLSETKVELESVARSHGWSIEAIVICELAASEESLKHDAQLAMFHSSEVELSETTDRILAEAERTKPRRVVFDSLSEMRLLAQNPLRYRRQILALKQFFAGRECTVLLLDDQTSDSEDSQLQSIANGVISMTQLVPEYGAERRRLRVVKMRGMHCRGGYHDFVIQRGGLKVFPRLVAAEHHQPFAAEELKSGVAELDQLLGGGLDRGTSTLLMGPAGCGKTSIAVQYAVTAARLGERTAIFMFDENPRTLLTRAAKLGMGLENDIKAGRITIQQIDPAELSPGEFAHNIRNAVENNGARIVVIDSLNGYLNAMPEERFLSIQLHELLSYLAQVGVSTFIILAQHGLVGGTLDVPVDISYLSDTVILVRYFEARGQLRRAISVVKKRSGTHEDFIRELRLGADGIRISERLDEFQGILAGVPSFLGPLAKHDQGK